MVKPKFNLRVPSTPAVRRKTKPETKAEAQVYRSSITRKEQQIKAAVDWCKENGKRGKAALNTGNFPLIKNRGTIDRRLDGKVKNAKKEHLRILLPEEERQIVDYIKNKNRAHQGLSKKQVSELIIDILKIRHHINMKSKGGRKFAKLSTNAKNVISKGR